ncbi:MAG: DoxX family protein, partial [Acidimicrobiia bacterium]
MRAETDATRRCAHASGSRGGGRGVRDATRVRWSTPVVGRRTRRRRYGRPAMSDADSINLALLAFRCCVGAVMLAHGLNHIYGGGKIEGTGRWFESLGMRPGRL